MKKSLIVGSLVFAAACQGSQATPDGGGGAGGMGGAPSSSSRASTVSSSKASSITSGGMIDAGADAEAGCATCEEAINGPDHEAALRAFCAGSEAFSFWAMFIACACSAGGSCSGDCSGSAFCAAAYVDGGAWVDPIGSCAACLASDGGTGCGTDAYFCSKN